VLAVTGSAFRPVQQSAYVIRAGQGVDAGVTGGGGGPGSSTDSCVKPDAASSTSSNNETTTNNEHSVGQSCPLDAEIRP